MILTEPCEECGAQVRREVPEWSRPWVAGVPLLCDECIERAEADDRAESSARLAERQQEVHRAALRRSRVPRLPTEFRWPESPAGVAAAEWAGRKTLTLTLCGGVGVGKTMLAAAAFRQRLQPVIRRGTVWGRPGAWRSAASLMASLGEGFGGRGAADVARLADGDIVLALDDLDKTRGTEYAAEQLFAIIDAAVVSGSPLIVTMNGTPSGLGERFGPAGAAIASRLSAGVVVRMSGDDRRPGGGSRG